MSIAELAQFLTPHLARSAPEAANIVPFLLALGIVVYVGSIVAMFYLIRWARRLKPDEKLALEQKGVLTSFREAQRTLTRARNAIRVFAVLLVVLWLSLYLAGSVTPVLTEVLFLVVGLIVLAPTYFATSHLAAAFHYVADHLIEGH